MPNGTHRAAARLGAALAALALAGAPRPGAAQTAPGLTLDEVVGRTLSGSPAILGARARLESGRGELLAAGAPFDLNLGASVAGARTSQYVPGQEGLVAAHSRSTEYALEATRQLRGGLVVQPRVTVSRTTQEGVPAADAGSSVSLNVSVPLLRDRFGRASAAPERAARVLLDASGMEVRHAVASGVLEAAGAYWSYAAAHERVAVYAETEARALRRLEETRLLVAGDERPASDLDPLQAAVARARQQRIAAEQGVDEARRALGLAMGLDAADIAALPAPATAFPAAQAWSPDAAEEARLVRLALANRADVAGAALERRSGDILLEGARSELKPRLDLQLGVGYSGRQLANGYGGLVEPLYQDVPGLNASVQVAYALPVGNVQARGAALQRQALQTQRRVAEADLARRVESGVALAARALRRRAAELAEAERAVALFRTTVENELKKNRLGAATVFDVTYAEDNLTSALLTVVNGRLGYAAALAQLRFETGTLAAGDAAVDPASLVTRP
jgi:outer membrane protein TolC